MNIHEIRKKKYEAFREGKTNIYIIVRKNADLENIKEHDVLLRKVDDTYVSILGWIEKKQAEEFLADNIKNAENDNYKFVVDEITGPAFRKFLNQYDPQKRKCILLDLI